MVMFQERCTQRFRNNELYAGDWNCCENQGKNNEEYDDDTNEIMRTLWKW